MFIFDLFLHNTSKTLIYFADVQILGVSYSKDEEGREAKKRKVQQKVQSSNKKQPRGDVANRSKPKKQQVKLTVQYVPFAEDIRRVPTRF